MYNSNFGSTIQMFAFRIIYILGLFFVIKNSKFTKENKAKNWIADILIVVISIAGIVINLKKEIINFNYYTEMIFSIKFVIQIFLAIVLLFLILMKSKMEMKSVIVKAVCLTTILTAILHIEFFGYVNSYVLVCSQNEMPIFSILIIQLFVFVLIYEFIKNFKNKKDNLKIIFLILLFLTITTSRFHVEKYVSLKSYLDVILDMIDDILANAMQIGLFTYIVYLTKNKNTTNEKDEKDAYVETVESSNENKLD